MYVKCAYKASRTCGIRPLVILVEPVEQRLEIEIDHKRCDTEHGVRDGLMLEDTTHFSADLLAHTSERRQYDPAVEEYQTLLLLRRKLVDLVA